MKEKKQKFALWVYPSTMETIERYWESSEYRSKSDFIEKAVLFYAGFLSAQTYQDYLPNVVVSCMKGTLGSFERRTSNILFKVAVELSMHIFNVGVGMTFSGGLIDLTLFGILQGNARTNWIWIVIVGVVYFFLYYFTFRIMITKMDLATPGREPDVVEPKLFTRSDYKEKTGIGPDGSKAGSSDPVSSLILQGLGGKKNISDVDCCATRLRVTVVDEKKVDDKTLKASGASGVIHKGNGIQVIYGPQVSVIKSNLVDFMESPESDNPGAVAAAHIAEAPAAPAKEARASILSAHMNGTVLALCKVEDQAFASGAMGDGVAIEPVEGKLFAPADGVIESVFETKHAVGMTTDDGVEVLMHMKELETEGIPYNPDTELGIMIETPSSVFVAEELAKLVDFFSVGTNDLTQYTLACDRQANDLGKFYDPHHPALLRAIKMAADAAHKAGIWIGICGELGADISMLPTFLAIGIDELSVSPAAVLPVRAAIRQSIAQTCTLEMLEC